MESEENMVEKLTTKQNAFYSEIERAILNKEFALYNSNWYDRGWGKTTVINEIGFTYQALGYTVYILSPCRTEYFACKLINKKEDLRGIKRDNLIVLVDEVLRDSELYTEVKSFCQQFNIPIVGFIRY